MKPIYQEQQKTYLLVVMVFIVVAAVLLAMVLWPGRSLSTALKILLLIITIIDLVLFWSYSQLTIKITENYLQLSFGIFKKKISFSEIQEIKVIDYDKTNYTGYGIRLGKDKSVGYIARDGRGVGLKLKTENLRLPSASSGRGKTKNYFFTSERPEEIEKILKSRIQFKKNG